MSTRIESFSPKHIASLELRYADWYALRYSANWRAEVAEFMAIGYSNSLFVNDELVIIANLRMLWNGVGEVWALTSPAATRYPLALCKVAREWLNQYIDDLGLHRVQCKVIAGFKESHAWTKWLGFTPEAYMKKYGPYEEDYVQYARIV